MGGDECDLTYLPQTPLKALFISPSPLFLSFLTDIAKATFSSEWPSLTAEQPFHAIGPMAWSNE